MNVRLPVMIALFAVALPTGATEYVKETTLLWVGAQGTRPIQTSTQNSVFVSLPPNAPSWSVSGGTGGGTCSDAAAILPNDPMIRAIALSAISSGAVVSIAVDNTLPMMGAYCTVSVLSIKAN